MPPDRFAANHGSSMTELADGTILCSWYAGSHECARDVQIYLSRFQPNGKTWSDPTVAVARGERAEGRWFRTKSVGNTALFRDHEDVIWLFYAALPFGGWSTARVDYKTSLDQGQTWSPARTLVNGYAHLPRAKPISAGASFIVPLYRGIWRKRSYLCTITPEHGSVKAKVFQDIPGVASFQPALVRQNSGELVAYLRNPKWTGLLFSRFDAVNSVWSETETLHLPNPNSAIDAVLSPEGKTLLILNNSTTDRTPLTLAISDDGRSFKAIWDFENKKGSGFSYPALLRGSDGSYHLSYSHRRRAIKHIRFTEQWLSERMSAVP